MSIYMSIVAITCYRKGDEFSVLDYIAVVSTNTVVPKVQDSHTNNPLLAVHTDLS
jgi:hypothetical protein